MDQVKLDTGSISGMKASQNGQGIYVFRGIPFAAPPIGDLRWKPPQSAASWSDVRECTKFSIQAAQYPDKYSSDKMQASPSSEDCLYLNVMTPAQKATDKLPVMVWFHGGGTRYGNGNLPVSNSLGLPSHGVVILKFSGNESFVVPPGALFLSDPVDLNLAPFSNLAISLYLPKNTGSPTNHTMGLHTAYISKGNVTGSEDMPEPTKTYSYLWLTGVDVLAPADSYAIVALGDSITDGFTTTVDANTAWPALLAKRLAANKATRNAAVLNQGISGNQVVRDGAGVSALARFDRDVLGRPGVRWVILLEGISDINIRGRSAGPDVLTSDELIAGYRQIIERGHMHGNGEAQNGWVMNGRANIILDNLIADKKAQPMIVVMPQGHALQGANVGPLVRLTGEMDMFSKRFPQDLLQEVIPLVERNYRVYRDADQRAIAGLSMGGGQALSIGLARTDLFHYVLGFSGAVGGPFMNAETEFGEAHSKPEVLNSRLRLLWVSCGKQDFLYQANRQFVEMLKSKGVKLLFRETEGSHVWSVWRNYLNETAPMLFTDLHGKK